MEGGGKKEEKNTCKGRSNYTIWWYWISCKIVYFYAVWSSDYVHVHGLVKIVGAEKKAEHGDRVL